MKTITRSLALLTLALLGGCPKRSSTLPAPAPTPGPGSQLPPAPWRPPRLEMIAEVADLDDALTKGDANRYLAHFSPDPYSFMLGSGPGELYVGPQAFSDTIRRSLARGGILVRQTDIQTYAAADNSGGVAYVEFEVLTFQGERQFALPMRMTLVFERGYDNRLRIVGGHTSVAIADGALLARAAAGTATQPTQIQQTISPTASELYQTVMAMQQGGWDAVRRYTSTAPTVLIVGTAPGERWTGTDYAGEPRPPVTAPLTPSYGPAHVWVSQRGTWGFATYLVTLTGDVGGAPVSVQNRVTEVFERGADGWKRVHAHASAPMAPADLSGAMVAR